MAARRFSILQSMWLACAAVALPTPSLAATITHTFGGTFNQQFGLSGYNFSGATISGSYTYDVPVNCGSATECSYVDVFAAPSALTGTVTWNGGSFSFAFGSNEGNITVWNNRSGNDFYEARAGGGDGVYDNDLANYNLVAFNLSMIATNALGTITSTDIPSTLPFFGTPTILLTFGPTRPAGCTEPACLIENKLQFAMTEQQVPEPGTLALLGLGLAGLAGLRRRKH